MRKILIIEDAKQIANKLETIALELNPNIKVYKTGSKVGAIDIISFHKIDAFFIDIQLEDYNGMDLAKELRIMKCYQFVPMVFITAVPTRELEAFKQIHSYDYILKPFTLEQIKRVFKEILLDYFDETNEEDSILLEYKAYNHAILTKDILFIEMINRRIHVITKEDTVEYIIMPLKKFEERLPEGFLRIHQSFIVNLKYVTSFSLSLHKVEMKGYDNDLPIGRSYIKKIRGQL
jgi:two-component system LytT family response regulator